MTTISFAPSNSQLTRQEKREKRIENTQNVAAAGTAGYASKKYLKTAFDTVTKTAKTVEMNAAEATGLWSKFQKDIVRFSKDITARLEPLKNNKWSAPIMKSKALQMFAGGFGVVMAAFVLVTGVSDAIKTGKIAAGDLKDHFDKLVA